MKLPEARDRIKAIGIRQAELTQELYVLAQEAIALTEQLKRRSPVRRVGPRLIPLTPERRAALKDYADTHPLASYIDIAKVFHTSIGRVSEVVAGFRT